MKVEKAAAQSVFWWLHGIDGKEIFYMLPNTHYQVFKHISTLCQSRKDKTCQSKIITKIVRKPEIKITPRTAEAALQAACLVHYITFSGSQPMMHGPAGLLGCVFRGC